MTLGNVESQPIAAVVSTILTPLAQGGHDSSAGAPLTGAALPSIVVLLLCVAAGVGTYFLLPGKRSTAGMRNLGGVTMLFAALVLGLLLVKYAAGRPEGGPGVYFWIFSAIALFGALRVITHPRPVYAALYFVLTVFATAGLFILLWAEFMAMALVLIYAGAILITYVFVIMLAASSVQGGVEKVNEYDTVSRDPMIASAVGFALMGVLIFVIFDRAEPIPAGHAKTFTYVATKSFPSGRTVQVSGEVQGADAEAARERIPSELDRTNARLDPAYSVQALGRYLFRDQGVNLELSGLILTLGMIGAILIARRRVILPEGEGPGGRAIEAFIAPATPINDDPHSIPVYGTDNPNQKAYPET